MTVKLRPIFRITGLVLCIQAAVLLVPVLACLYWGEMVCLRSFIMSSLISAAAGLPLFFCLRQDKKSLSVNQALIAVLFVWLAITLSSALPYMLSSEHSDLAGAMFESVSSWTTTGATALEDTAVLPRSLSFWRSLTQWMGGAGILVMLSLLLRGMGGSTMLMKLEAPGIVMSENTARYMTLAGRLIVTYLSLSAIQYILLLFAGCGPFDSLIITFSSCATGGATCYYDSLASFSPAVRFISALFMVLSSLSLVLYYNLVKGDFRSLRKNSELKVFLGLIAVCGLIISVDLKACGIFTSFGEALESGFFHTVSFATTTGLYTTDCQAWPTLSRVILTLLTFFGGCSLSTAGAIKIFRIAILVKLLRRSFLTRLHPAAVKSIKINDRQLPAQVINSVVAFFLTYLMTYFAGVFVISFEAVDLQTAFTASAALLNNIGSGFGSMGLNGIYADFSSFMKLFMSLLMLAGRLELYAVILPFTSYFRNEE